VEDALAEYGFNVGLAFQITDDLLDLIGDPALTGKPIGGDIREGKVTLPVILAMQSPDPELDSGHSGSPDDRTLIERILSSGDTTPADLDFVRRAVEETGSIEATRETASEDIRRAPSFLPPLRTEYACWKPNEDGWFCCSPAVPIRLCQRSGLGLVYG
jgi:octaprenyl-diphosphate synthase